MSLLKRKHPIELLYTYTEQTLQNHKPGVYKKYPVHFLIKYVWAVFYVFFKTIDKLLVFLLD